MIAKASPRRVLPSKMVETALASDNSDFKVSFSFWRTEGISSLRWLWEVSRCPYFSRNERRQSILDKGIPAVKKLWIRSKRYRRISWGNVSPLGCFAWSFLPNNSSTDWSFFLLSKIVFLAFTCFNELMCFLTVLFFLLIVSLQASHLNLPSTEVRYSFLCSWTRCHELNFGSLCPRVERLLPAGLVCSFLSLAILAFSGVRTGQNV